MTTSRRRPGLSVRTRLVSAVALLVTAALVGAGVLLLLLGEAEVERRVAYDSDQEIAEFTGLREKGIDPLTGQPFVSVERLLRVYLERNVPGAGELLVGWWDGRVRVASASTRGALVDEAAFVEAVRDRVTSGGATRVDSAWGEVTVDVLPLSGAEGSGAFVVARFVDLDKAELHRLLRTYAVAAVLALALVTSVAFWQAGRLLAPLRILRTTAEEISETDLSRRIPETGNDDLTDLTRTVNAMLARLQDAFAGQRAFLDDAGHELRTPLTILQGHLELMDPGNEAETRETRALLLDEVDRMSRLVDDLIVLTKADRPGFFTFADTDLDDLTRTALTKATGLGDRAWELDASASYTVGVDGQRLTQALLQLAQNAVRHTRPGDTVAFGSAYDFHARKLRLWVRDTGPGVADADKERIFDRFVRTGATDQPNDDGGFGLGLSLVRAIAEGHGGRVWVEDARPGARFVLELPDRREP